jgi:hypothetical protein
MMFTLHLKHCLLNKITELFSEYNFEQATSIKKNYIWAQDYVLTK